MVTPLRAYLGLLALVGGERVIELALSARNARRLLARGGVEHGRGHYPAMVLLHAGFLAACAGEALARPEPPPPIALAAAAGAVAAQGLRWWAISTLGERWSTRVVVLPGSAPVVGGPYRWLRHPNYLAVIAELACLPLAWGSWRTALAFSLANAGLLTVRVTTEERALGDAWSAELGGRPRFLPGSAR